MSRRAMEGDWVTIEGDRVHLEFTAREARSGQTELYRHYDMDGRLLYVGISLSTVVRLALHNTESEWFDRIARIEIERFPTRVMAEQAEQKAIRNENPEFNITYSFKVRRTKRRSPLMR